MLDLEPATLMLTRLVAGVRDEQLTAPTPCTEACLGAVGPPVAVPADAPLLDRLIGLTGRDPAWRAAASHG